MAESVSAGEICSYWLKVVGKDWMTNVHGIAAIRTCSVVNAIHIQSHSKTHRNVAALIRCGIDKQAAPVRDPGFDLARISGQECIEHGGIVVAAFHKDECGGGGKQPADVRGLIGPVPPGVLAED